MGIKPCHSSGGTFYYQHQMEHDESFLEKWGAGCKAEACWTSRGEPGKGCGKSTSVPGNNKGSEAGEESLAPWHAGDQIGCNTLIANYHGAGRRSVHFLFAQCSLNTHSSQVRQALLSHHSKAEVVLRLRGVK